ncbi:hypothetical protein, partial [Aeromonas caviae]
KSSGFSHYFSVTYKF